MMTQPFAGFARSAVVAAAGLLTALPTVAFASAAGSVVIERIETRKASMGREVVIHTTKEPTFSVFRLSEPFRVLVDVNDARMAKSMDLKKVDDGVIRYVSTNQFADETSTILRVEIALEESAPYSVRAEGNSIVVSIEAGRETPVPEVNVKPAPVAAASPANELAQLGKVVRRIRDGRAILSAQLSGHVDASAVVIEKVEDPTRLVVDVIGAQIEPKWQRVRVNRHGVTMVRVANKEGAVRFVLDITRDGDIPVVNVDSTSKQLEISIAAAPKRAPAVAAKVTKPLAEVKLAELDADDDEPMMIQPVASKPEPVPEVKPQPAPVAAAPAPAAKPAARRASTAVSDVRFEPKDGFVRLTLTLEDENAPAAKEDAELPTLRISGATLPRTLERTLDVSEVAGRVVESISTYNDGGDTVVVATIADGTEHRHWRKGNKLMWDFRNGSAKAAAPEVLSYSPEATSSYAMASGAAQTIGKTATGRTQYKGRRISLDLKDADILNVLRLLADVSKLNIVASDEVTGKVTIKLRNVPWDQALDIILRSKQLDKVRNGNIIRVAQSTTLQKEEELRIDRAKAKIELEPLTVRLIPVSYAVANEVKPQVSALLSPRGKVNIDSRTNVLVVEDISEVLLKVERLVRTLDTQTPQVLIEARIVEARSNFSRELGIQWGGSVNATQGFGTSTGLAFPNNVVINGGADDQTNNITTGVTATPNYAINLPAPSVGSGGGGALGFTFGSIGGAALISLRLSAAESIGKVKIISAPKVVTLDNREAKIVSGEKIPITVVTANGPTTRFIDANLELKVTPHVTQDGSILMKISAKKNELSDRRDLLGVPGIITKEAETEMIVRDGDTAVLGGIYRRTATDNKNYVPWIGQIPVLGWIFKRTNRTDSRDELLIFISPRIVNRSAALVQSS